MRIVCFCFCFRWYSNTNFKCWVLIRFIVESPLFFCCFFFFLFLFFSCGFIKIKYYCIYTLVTSISPFLSHPILVLWLKWKFWYMRNCDDSNTVTQWHSLNNYSTNMTRLFFFSSASNNLLCSHCFTHAHTHTHFNYMNMSWIFEIFFVTLAHLNNCIDFIAKHIPKSSKLIFQLHRFSGAY